MRIAHVIDSLADSGGAEHGLVREITRLSADHDQVVYGLYRNSALAPRLEAGGIRVEMLGFDASRGARTLPLMATRLRSRLRSLQPDVIQSSLFMGNLCAQLAARSLGLPVVSTFALSGDPSLLKSFQPGADSVRAELLRRLGGIAARHRLISFRALTEDAKRTNADLLNIPLERVSVIPRGVPEDLVPASRRTRAELGLPEGCPLLVNVGRHTAQKGHAHLIKAFAAVHRETGAHLAMCGREADTYQSTLELIEELDLGEHVTILGQTPLVYHVVAAADVFVFSSVMEGLGTAVLEAMAIGTPVVAFDIPPVREATGDGEFAWLVPLGDDEALAERVVEAVDGRASEMAGRARSFVAENRSVDSVAHRVEQLLVSWANAPHER